MRPTNAQMTTETDQERGEAYLGEPENPRPPHDLQGCRPEAVGGGDEAKRRYSNHEVKCAGSAHRAMGKRVTHPSASSSLVVLLHETFGSLPPPCLLQNGLQVVLAHPAQSHEDRGVTAVVLGYKERFRVGLHPE